jgi:isocitrate lyase
MSGNQAVQQVKAGLNAIYISGWQVAADANGAGQMYPDQSLYPVNSVPNLCRSINNSLARADQIHHEEGKLSLCVTAQLSGICICIINVLTKIYVFEFQVRTASMIGSCHW